MGFFIPWLADAARLTGYPVVECAGWRTHGHGPMRVAEGITDHHTADGPSGNYPSLNIVRNGRAGLAGPLSQLGLGRDGTIYVIAAGCTWHAGASQWAGFRDLNDEFIGIEAESRGTVDDWTPAQRDCYPRLNAALCHFMRRGADRVAGHKEICIPAGRKPDPAFWDMNQMRGKVAWYLQDPLGRIPRGGAGSGGDELSAADVDALKKHIDMQVGFIRDQIMGQIDKQVGTARNQIMIAMGFDDPVRAPAQVTKPTDNDPTALARRVDVGFVLDELRKDINEIKTRLPPQSTAR